MKQAIKELIKKSIFYRIYLNQKRKKLQKRLCVVSEAFKKEAVDVLRLFSDALVNENLVFWLCAGTLLGYYREHDFIKHDFDLDTGAWFEDHDRIKVALEKNGFERVRYYYLKNRDGIEETYKHRDYSTTIDIFYFFNDGNESYHFSFVPMVTMRKKRHLNKLQDSRARKWTYALINPIPTEFKGVKVYVPENSGQHLASTYGESFMTPIPNFPLQGRPNMIEYSYDEMPAYAIMSVGYF